MSELVSKTARASRTGSLWRGTSTTPRRRDTRPPIEQSHTFLFADLAGFTAMTEAHGDEFAAQAVAGLHAGVSLRLG